MSHSIRQLRKPILAIAAILPQGIKKFIYRYLFRWKIGKNVKIGFSFIDSDNVIIGDNTRIGHFNSVRGLRELHIGSDSYLANFNDIFGARIPEWPNSSVLEIGDHVNFMSHHFVDVGGKVVIGSHVTVGGRDTHFWSHSMYVENNMSVMKPTRVLVGDDVYIGARATLVGCSIPAGAFVGAGSIVTKDFSPEPCRVLIAGNPATIKKRYPGNTAIEGIPE